MCQVVTCTTEKNKARGTEMDRGELLLFYIVGWVCQEMQQ